MSGAVVRRNKSLIKVMFRKIISFFFSLIEQICKHIQLAFAHSVLRTPAPFCERTISLLQQRFKVQFILKMPYSQLYFYSGLFLLLLLLPFLYFLLTVFFPDFFTFYAGYLSSSTLFFGWSGLAVSRRFFLHGSIISPFLFLESNPSSLGVYTRSRREPSPLLVPLGGPLSYGVNSLPFSKQSLYLECQSRVKQWRLIGSIHASRDKVVKIPEPSKRFL